MIGADCRLQLGIAVLRGLDQQRMLLVLLRRAVPAVDRGAGGEDIDASGKPLADEKKREFFRTFAVRQTGEDQQALHSVQAAITAGGTPSSTLG